MSGWRGTTPPQMVSGDGVQDDKVRVILTNSAGKWVLNSEAVAVYTQHKHGVSRDRVVCSLRSFTYSDLLPSVRPCLPKVPQPL